MCWVLGVFLDAAKSQLACIVLQYMCSFEVMLAL